MQLTTTTLATLCFLAAAVITSPIPQPQDDSGFDDVGGNGWNTDGNSIPADGSTGDGDGQGFGYSDGVGDSGGMSCLWSDPNGCEQ